jgi:hypothetical protein
MAESGQSIASDVTAVCRQNSPFLCLGLAELCFNSPLVMLIFFGARFGMSADRQYSPGVPEQGGGWM